MIEGLLTVRVLLIWPCNEFRSEKPDKSSTQIILMSGTNI